MPTYTLETPYGIHVSELLVTRVPICAPICAVVTFHSGEQRHVLRFTNPQPVSATTSVLDGECRQLRITDRNEDGAQLEFGRYNVEVWDEDNPFAEFTVDDFDDNPVES